MKTSRPYLIRAMHEWIIDCDLTPYALVDANHTDVIIPTEYIEDGKILLNVSPGATQNLNLGNEYILFSARFNGKAMEVSFPVEAVLAIYAKENGRGMMFKDDGADIDANQTNSDQRDFDQKISNPKASDQKNSDTVQAKPSGPVGLKSRGLTPKDSSLMNTNSDDSDPDDSGPSGSTPSGSKKPSLKIVK